MKKHRPEPKERTCHCGWVMPYTAKVELFTRGPKPLDVCLLLVCPDCQCPQVLAVDVDAATVTPIVAGGRA